MVALSSHQDHMHFDPQARSGSSFQVLELLESLRVLRELVNA